MVWNDPDKTAIGNYRTTHLKVPIDSETAIVNGQTVRLEMPAFLEFGSTMVPLSFVRNALGARIAWSSDSRVVRIDTFGPGVSTASYGDIDEGPTGRIYDNTVRANATVTPDTTYRRSDVVVTSTRNDRDNAYRNYRTTDTLKIAEHSIIACRLDRTLSSDRTVPGDPFTMTVVSGSYGFGLPQGCKIEGVVRDAIPARGNRPGLLELDVKRFTFPNGTSRSCDARFTLAPSDTQTVTYNSQGKTETIETRSKKHIKFIGVGPAARICMATHVKNGAAIDSVVKGDCGFVSEEFRRTGAHDVALPSGMELGIQLNKTYTFTSADIG